MPYFERDPRVLGWFDQALSHPTAHVRRSAVSLLEHVECGPRDAWLQRAGSDPDPTVASAAVVVSAISGVRGRQPIDLYESDLASGMDADDLQWEWEYGLVVCHGYSVPCTRTLAWVKDEDDSLAREIALLKCYAGKEAEAGYATAVIVSKRLVTRYTRSPRTFAEAMRWHHQGRPRYSDP